MSKKSTELSINIVELRDQHRYGLILRAVQLGLKELGVKGITLSPSSVEDGRFVFTMGKK